MSSLHVVRNMDTVARDVWREERPGFKPRLVLVLLVVDRMILGQVFLRILLVFLLSSSHQCSKLVFNPYSTGAVFLFFVISVIVLLVLNGGS